MKRRMLMISMGSTMVCLPGCMSNGGSSPYTVENAPAWLQQKDECSEPNSVAKLQLAEETDSIPENNAGVQYDSFDGQQQTIINFAISREVAVSCENAKPFEQLMSTIRNQGIAPYREEYNSNPDSIYIRFSEGYRRIVELRVHDQQLP